jgi:hypothetical protein
MMPESAVVGWAAAVLVVLAVAWAVGGEESGAQA